ncbi:copper amine oxidase N-terminal domain-containing protein [Herbivorax sp. ANBcel31]|uniref:copper amine oxidase N-terminal domain-containing protein n=1 Tax=Herbivorax sp. ANBcel31 TaxID=3069754 RepID=UPI0027B14CD7|nr:copper amine oxidase N-terminal domain-containing protein [Herbivorax sp. ANBcel31]MDQ2086605.1 copper amine oxidase N-terminal domain-containing protein [Herbivorax sp. ANBcel31]
MKKIILIISLLVMIQTVLIPLNASSTNEKELKIIIDGKNLEFTDAKPFITNKGRTMIPVRAVSEGFGAEVDWNGAIEVVTITLDNVEVCFKLNYIKDKFSITDTNTNSRKYIEMLTSPIIVNGRTFVPLREFSEIFNHEIIWDGENYSVIINTKNSPPVFPLNPALTKGDYNLSNLYSDGTNSNLSEQDMKSYQSSATSYIEYHLGNVDYTEETDFEYDSGFPGAPFNGLRERVYNHAVENSIIREVRFISDPSMVEVTQPGLTFDHQPDELIVKGKVEFIYHEASDEYLKKFNGKLEKGKWYTTDAIVVFRIRRTEALTLFDNVLLSYTWELK